MTLSIETKARGVPLTPPPLVANSLLPFPYASSWIKAGSLCGVNVLNTFEAHQIAVDLGNPLNNRVQPLQLLQALSSCTRAASRSHFPLVLGEHLFFDQTPAAETFLITSPTLRDALKLVDWALRLVPLGYKLELVENDEEAWLIFSAPHNCASEASQRYIIECMMAVVKRISGYLLGCPLSLRAVHFTHDRPSYFESYTQHFQLEPRYNQAKNALYFHRDLLDTPLPGARPDLHQHACELLHLHTASSDDTGSFSQSVIARLRQQTDLLSGSLEDVAQSFGMSNRTFQRRLNKEGCAFSDLIKAAQCALATEWLAETQMDINLISSRLGYQSRRAFTSAFKQWKGTTPSDFRAQVLKG
jgi:AraC-like DNA-binding protein